MAVPSLDPHCFEKPARDHLGRIVSAHVDLPIGSTYGRLMVIGGEHRVGKNYVVKCRCDCGAEIQTRVDGLKQGKKLQCGKHARVMPTRQKAAIGLRNRTHGMAGQPEYNAWLGMRARCGNPNNDRFADYGGRGIRVHPSWQASFEIFLKDMGSRPSPEHSIDRINVDGDYEPNNVRWADRSQQVRNRRPFVIRPGTGKKLRPLPSPPEFIPPTRINTGYNSTHGMSKTPEYQAWLSMKKRCLDPKHPAYRNYGARGITVHECWHHDFAAFLSCVGMRPQGRYSLDRIDNTRGYEPGNVRWADPMTQNRNRRAFAIVGNR